LDRTCHSLISSAERSNGVHTCLATPKFQETFHCEIDACEFGIGAVLMQEHHPIAFMGKALGQAHLSLSIYEKRILVAVNGC
jgi:hypothetical protein